MGYPVCVCVYVCVYVCVCVCVCMRAYLCVSICYFCVISKRGEAQHMAVQSLCVFPPSSQIKSSQNNYVHITLYYHAYSLKG